jgi:hypothetical protein
MLLAVDFASQIEKLQVVRTDLCFADVMNKTQRLFILTLAMMS